MHLKERTPRSDFRRPILEVLDTFGGEDRIPDIVKDVGKKLRYILKPGDEAIGSDGTPKWQKALLDEISVMASEGLITIDWLKGICRLTATGEKWLLINY